MEIKLEEGFSMLYIDTWFEYWYNEVSKEGKRCIKLMKLEQ